MRAAVDITNDQLLDTGTYNGASSGTVTAAWPALGIFFDTSLATAWNTSGSDQPHLGGHYVYFTRPSDNQMVIGPRAIVEMTRDNQEGYGMVFWPPVMDPAPGTGTGLTYTIRKLPSVRVGSLALAEVDLGVPT